MSNQMKSKKDSTAARIANLLATFQHRLDTLTVQVAATNTAAVTNAEDLQYFANKLIDAHRMAEDALLDHKTQKGTNKQVAESFEKLRNSVQVSFDSVGSDVKNLLVQIQRLNERLGQLESKGIPADVINRLQAVEAEVELITNFRKAQAAFVLGPTKVTSAIPTPGERLDVDDECD